MSSESYHNFINKQISHSIKHNTLKVLIIYKRFIQNMFYNKYYKNKIFDNLIYRY